MRASHRAGRSSRCDWPPQTIAREVERRAPDLATSRWWKEEREGVFVDFNQNAKDRTVASAYSVRPRPTPGCRRRCCGTRSPTAGPRQFTIATVPDRFADFGDPWEGMDDAAGALDALLDARRRARPAGEGAARRTDAAGQPRRHGRRQSAMPLIEIARTKTKDEAMAALDVWRERYPAAAEKLEPADVLVDGMRGPSSIWYRIRINLQHVPEDQRPPQEPLLADYSPWENYSGPQWMRGE